MPHYKYLIIGGGMTADSAVKGIREIDLNGSIGVIAGEPNPPYKRPPLSKGLWKNKPEESIWLHTDEAGIELMLERRVVKLTPGAKLVTDGQGINYSYDKLLLANGGTPRRLQFDPKGVIYYRTFADYKLLRSTLESCKRFAVIGGGFIGSEIAAALTMNGAKCTMIFPDDGISGMQFPKDLAEYVSSYYRERGVEVISDDVVSDVTREKDEFSVNTLGGRRINAGAVVAGLGILPNVGLAEDAGLGIDNGVSVDVFLRAGAPDVFAAGDVASFFNPALGKRMRVEHEDNALTMGRHAGLAMAGRMEPYEHLPYFYSDLFDLGYEAVGEINSRHDIFADWKEPFKEGVIYYLKDQRLRGVLLWNVWDKVPAARELIAQGGPFTEEDLKGAIS